MKMDRWMWWALAGAGAWYLWSHRKPAIGQPLPPPKPEPIAQSGRFLRTQRFAGGPLECWDQIRQDWVSDDFCRMCDESYSDDPFCFPAEEPSR